MHLTTVYNGCIFILMLIKDACMKTHVFELSGLGKAPFNVVDYFYGGVACDHCGRWITHVFVVKSSDGQRSHVGSGCVHSTGDKGLVKETTEKKRDEKNRIRRESLKAYDERVREKERERKALRQAHREAYEKAKPKLSALPHPNNYFAKRGKTLLDYTEYLIRHGMAGYDSPKITELLK